jgi:hypothetical protein
MIHTRSIRRGIAFTSVAALAFGVLAGCGGSLTDYGCSDRDVKLADTLNELPVLGASPENGKPVSEESGCDDDDGFAYATRYYASDLDRARLQDFYRTAAERDGWQSVNDTATSSGEGLVTSIAASCFTREMDGVTAHLGLFFPSDLNGSADSADVPEDEYGLRVTASHDGNAWC